MDKEEQQKGRKKTSREWRKNLDWFQIKRRKQIRDNNRQDQAEECCLIYAALRAVFC